MIFDMNIWREESESGPNRFSEEVPLPPLNLPLTKSPEFLSSIESALKQDHPCPHQQIILPYSTENTKTLTPTKLVKTKAMNFPISKITIGQWTSMGVYPDDLKAKFYFAKRKLMWEILDNVETGTQVERLKKKIEIHWNDVLSFRRTFHPHDETETLQVELGKRPAFFVETNPQARKHTQWKQMDQDFTLNQSASKYRRHTLHFSPGVLQNNWEKLVSGDSFWSDLVNVTFPTLPHSLYFDISYGNCNNKESSSSSRYGQFHTLSFNVNNDLLHQHPQGFGHVPVGEVNFNLATQFCANGGRQVNSFVQDNHENKTMNQLPESQVIQTSSQLINRGRYFSRSQLNNPMIQDERQMRNTWEFRESQELLETQTNSMILEHVNETSIYPVGPYLRGYLAEEGETHNKEHTHLDDNFQTDSNCHYDQYFSNNNGSMPPDL